MEQKNQRQNRSVQQFLRMIQQHQQNESTNELFLREILRNWPSRMPVDVFKNTIWPCIVDIIIDNNVLEDIIIDDNLLWDGYTDTEALIRRIIRYLDDVQIQPSDPLWEEVYIYLLCIPVRRKELFDRFATDIPDPAIRAEILRIAIRNVDNYGDDVEDAIWELAELCPPGYAQMVFRGYDIEYIRDVNQRLRKKYESQDLKRIAGARGIDYVESTKADITRKFEPTGKVSAVSQQVFDRFTERPYTLYDLLDRLLEQKPRLSEAAMEKIRALPNAAHLFHVIEHATAKYRDRDDPFTLYHGTDIQSAISIITTGIDLVRGGGRHGTGFYVSPLPAYALGYATRTEKKGGVPCLLQLRIDAAEAKKLVFGEDFIFDMKSMIDTDTVFKYNPASYLEHLRRKIMELSTEDLIRFIMEHVAPHAFPGYEGADPSQRRRMLRKEIKLHLERESQSQKRQIENLLTRLINQDWFKRKRLDDSLPPSIRDELRFSSFMSDGGMKIIVTSTAMARALRVVRCFVTRLP